jgi:ABC-type transport system involved in multi-copper enzyme maturation permease subunit
LVFFQSTKDPNSGLGEARREVAFCERDRQRMLEQREGEPEVFECPTVEQVRQDKRFPYSESMHDVSRGVSIALAVVALVVGASFAGAEWGSGSMAMLLTWEPRRGRILLSKTIAIAVVAFSASAAFLTFLALIHFPVGLLRGITSGMTGEWWRELAGTWLRGGAIAAVTGSIGVGIATFTRNTAGAIGIGVVYGAMVDPLVSAWRNGLLRPWLLQYNLARFLGFPVPVEVDPFQTDVRILSPWRPAVWLCVVVAALLAAAYGVFRARDVT